VYCGKKEERVQKKKGAGEGHEGRGSAGGNAAHGKGGSFRGKERNEGELRAWSESILHDLAAFFERPLY